MAIKFKDPPNHSASIDTLDMDPVTVGFTAYGWVKRTADNGNHKELLNVLAGAGAENPYLGWDESNQFNVVYNNIVHVFDNQPALNSWFFWAVTIIDGADGFKARWWNEDGTLGDEYIVDSVTTSNVHTVHLMGFPGNGQGVPGKIARSEFVPALLNQLALELVMSGEDPETPPEVCIPNDTLVDDCNGHDIIVEDPGDIESEPGDNPTLPDPPEEPEPEEPYEPPAVSVTHQMVSGVEDETESGRVRPTEWNEEHDVSGLEADMGRPTSVAAFAKSGINGVRDWGQIAVAAPASASAEGVAGQIAFDSSHIYVCISPSTWKRASLEAL